MPRPVLFFDFDGTLIDSMPQHALIFGGLLEQAFGIDPDVAGRSYLSLAGQPIESQFEHALRHAGVHGSEHIAGLIDEFWTRYNALEAVPFPDVLAVIPLLADTYPLVVTTQGRQTMVEFKLRALGLDRHFALILGVDPDRPELSKGEPHFRIAAKALSLQPEDVAASVMTGDGAHDMRIAREAGMTAVGRITNGNAAVLLAAGAQHVIKDLHGLAALLNEA